MNTLLKYKLSSILILFLLVSSIEMFSTIKIKTSDSQEIELIEDILQISPVLKMLYSHKKDKTKPILLKEIDSQSIKLVMNVIQEVKNKVKQHLPTYKIKYDLLKKVPRTTQNVLRSKVKNITDFTKTLDYLAIDDLLKAFHSNNLSIADLIIENQIPKIENDILSLHGLGITDLFGLKYIKNIDDVESLGLSHNRLKIIPKDAFQGLDGLESLNLRVNNISHISVGAFEGLEDLEVLDLSNNPLQNLSLESFKGLEKIESINLYDTQLTNDTIRKIEKYLIKSDNYED